MAKNKKGSTKNVKLNNVSKNSKKQFKQQKSLKDGFRKNSNFRKKINSKSTYQHSSNPQSFNESKKNENRKENVSSKAPRKNKFTSLPLRERMLEKLKSAKFRYLNEQLYKANGQEMQQLFENDTKSYSEYHEGFRQQVAQWPINPVDVIIKSLLKKAKSDKITIVDFGCGEAKIAESLEDRAKVYSFDLVALNDRVTQCDMSHTSLQSSIVDVAVFCLSLMGTNLSAYLKEANRVLKDGGLLKIAEVESRFNNVDEFVRTLEKYGFKSTSVDLTHQLFYFFSFKKVSNISKKRKNKLPDIDLKPCLYKKR